MCVSYKFEVTLYIMWGENNEIEKSFVEVKCRYLQHLEVDMDAEGREFDVFFCSLTSLFRHYVTVFLYIAC